MRKPIQPEPAAYSYRIILSGEDDEKLAKEMRFKANRYYNELVELAHKRRAAFCLLRSKHGIADIARLEEELASVRSQLNEINDERKRHKSRLHYRAWKGKTEGKLSKQETAEERRYINTQLSTYTLQAAPLREKKAALNEQLKKAKSKDSAQLKPGNEEFDRRLKAANPTLPAMRATMWRVWKEMKDAGWDEYWVMAKEIDIHYLDLANQARHRHLGPGTHGIYTHVQRSFKQACKMAREAAKRPSKTGKPLLGLPHFKAFDGAGRLDCPQLTNGLTVSELFSAQDKRVGLHPPRNQKLTARKQQRGYAKTTGYIQVNNTPEGKPHHIDFIAIMHRPLPPDAHIREAYISIQKDGNTRRYFLNLSLHTTALRLRRAKRISGTGTGALNLGWRVVDGRIRLATFVNEEAGINWEWWMEKRYGDKPGFVERYQYYRHIRGVNDTYFDNALHELLARRPNLANQLPEELVEPLMKFNEQSRSSRKLARFVQKWVRHELTEATTRLMWVDWVRWRQVHGHDLHSNHEYTMEWAKQRHSLTDNQAFAFWLYVWAKKNAHLYDIERGVQGRAIRWRKNLYHEFALEMASQCERIVIHKHNIKVMSALPSPESEDLTPQERQAAYNRVVAGLYILKQEVESVFRDKCHIIETNEPVSALHRGCGGELFEDDRMREIHVHCAKCGEAVDQDRNAAANLLDAFNAQT